MTDRYLPLVERFGAALKRDEPLARYTVARLGGPADALLVARSLDDLTDAVALAHREGLPWIVLGAGANVLASDAGYRGFVVVNHAKGARVEEDGQIAVESGASLIALARQAVSLGLAGLEWAIGVPGTVGGAVINNAGAHGGEMAKIVRHVEVLNVGGGPYVELWSADQMRYAYRTSILKGQRGHYLVRAATLQLQPGCEPELLSALADKYAARRKRTQPPGASLGSIFRNPPGDYAGRLIEAAGLKGAASGGVMISPVHGNFIVHTGEGSAAAYRALIELARDTVHRKFDVTLDLEIQLIGEWPDAATTFSNHPQTNL